MSKYLIKHETADGVVVRELSNSPENEPEGFNEAKMSGCFMMFR